MISVRKVGASGALLLAFAVWLGGACNAISGIGDFDVVDAGTLPLQCDGPSCDARADCPEDNACQTWSCADRKCCRQALPEGTTVGEQKAGDCQKSVCDEAGIPTSIADDTDVPGAGQECSQGACAEGVPSQSPKNEGTPCVGGVCSADGACVECVANSDCGVPDPLCQAPACNNGVCSVNFLEGALPAQHQLDGDCRILVCNAGEVASTLDAMDVLVDGRECTQDTCLGMMASNPPLGAGAPCTQGGGKVCDGNGNCVECAADGDCASAHCSSGVCVSAQCTDGIKNGVESDVDCGGGSCAPCGLGKTCGVASDCQSVVCNGTCQPSSCTDGVTNGTETDVDCGGSCPADCADGKQCLADADCESHVCAGGMCAAPSCTDGVKNGSETDVDCGGPNCGPNDCTAGKGCLAHSDCASEACFSGKCAQITQIACGNAHACAIVDGAVHCWGYGAAGQLGEGGTASRTRPHLVPGLSGVTQIALGNHADDSSSGVGHTAAVLAGGARIWGYNDHGQCGNGGTSPVLLAPPAPVLTGVSMLSAQGKSTCALMTDNTVRCWGLNSNGELGDGSGVSERKSPPPTGIPGLLATSIVGGDNHVCVITTANAVKCWGDNAYGELGQGNTSGSIHNPVTVSGAAGALQVAAGARFTCAVMPGGTAKCWGDNSDGALGLGSTSDKSTPTSVPNLTGVTAMAAGSTDGHGGHTCAIVAGGALKCWGGNYHGEVGNGSTTLKITTPQNVVLGAPAAQVAAGLDFTCALLTTGALRCWGANNRGQLGTGNVTEQHTPAAVAWP